MIAAPSTASSARRGQHREGVDVGARHDRRRRVLGRRDRRHEAPAGGAAHDDVGRQQRALERARCASSPSATARRVLDRDGHADAGRRSPRPPATRGRVHRPEGEVPPRPRGGASSTRAPPRGAPAGTRKRVAENASVPGRDALQLQRGRRCAGCRPRRPAGRRSRTASASRSWSRPACTGRARSPPTAACRRAPRGRVMPAAPPPCRRSGGRRARALRAASASSVSVCSRTQPPPG